LDAIKFGAVIENVVINPDTRVPDYNDDSVTENTRCAYPLDSIPNVVPSGMGGIRRRLSFSRAMRWRDAAGRRLSPAQAMYHFMPVTRGAPRHGSQHGQRPDADVLDVFRRAVPAVAAANLRGDVGGEDEEARHAVLPAQLRLVGNAYGQGRAFR